MLIQKKVIIRYRKKSLSDIPFRGNSSYFMFLGFLLLAMLHFPPKDLHEEVIALTTNGKAFWDNFTSKGGGAQAFP